MAFNILTILIKTKFVFLGVFRKKSLFTIKELLVAKYEFKF